MKVALRVVGLALGLLGLALIAFALFYIALGSETASLAAGGHYVRPDRMTPSEIETRSRILGAVGVVVGALTSAAGVGVLLLKRWALFLSVVPVGLTLLFPPLSRLVFPPHFRFDGPDILEFAQAAIIALVASAALMFRKGFEHA